VAKRLTGSDKSFPKTKKEALPKLSIEVCVSDRLDRPIHIFDMEPRPNKSGNMGYYHSEPFLYGGLELVVMVKPPLHPYRK